MHVSGHMSWIPCGKTNLKKKKKKVNSDFEDSLASNPSNP